ncbi:MAG: T9SS type A sorting domain-containing protein [Bacteroidia bacterium]|nr:T9SS type A sorting domain-containing protein [Bacteroidia bacterium]
MPGDQNHQCLCGLPPSNHYLPSTPSICSGSGITLTAFGANSFTWNTGSFGSSISVSPTISTIYTVSGTNSSGCSSSSSVQVLVYSCQGLWENTENVPTVKIFPNPGSGSFEIRFPFPGNYELSVFNACGKLIGHYQTSQSFYNLDITKEPNGMYFLKINGDAFNSMLLKIIKN